MKPEVFSRITRLGEIGNVMAGIQAAEKAVFQNLKIKIVVLRGINDEEVPDFAALTLDKPIAVRFIEYMPAAGEHDWRSVMIGGDELLSSLSRRFALERVVNDALDGPAVNYRIKGAAGRVGFITPMSRHFCAECNRIRVTSSGMARGCLFQEGTTNLKPYLASGDAIGLRDALRRVAWRKPVRHSLLAAGEADRCRFSMSQIGG
jgi:cyclic pyranopterin phosphate synthase